jgi:hypothetical protein
VTPVEEQLEVLKFEQPLATLQRLPSGAYLVVVPDFPLPPGWSKPSTSIRFIAPVGYPLAKPDCFWADPDLRLASGGPPMNTGGNQIPEVPLSQLWFSWHVAAWDPNADSLVTYFHVIKNRLREAR